MIPAGIKHPPRTAARFAKLAAMLVTGTRYALHASAYQVPGGGIYCCCTAAVRKYMPVPGVTRTSYVLELCDEHDIHFFLNRLLLGIS